MAEAADPGGATLLHRLAQHAARTPERVAYTFLHENGEAADVSYRQLAARVAALAALLARRVAPGARALLLYPPGCGFVVAFFACLAAGVVAVPAAPAHRRRDAERLAALLADAAPAIVLGAPDAGEATRAALARAGCTAPLLCVDVGDAGISAATAAVDAAAAAVDAAHPMLPDAGALAFLQYTSGSTAQPKGVEITHANLAANVAAIGQAFGFGPRTVMVSWLPPFHDMGLVGSIAAPLALGFRSVLMSPGAFLRRPALWLETVTRYRATCTGAPNFAWDLCVRRIAPEAAARFDLSCLEVLYNGAEPVRAATLERFMAAFGSCGLRRGALFPCYGMAEATLLVAGGPLGRGPRILALDTAALERGQVRAAAGDAMGRAVVSCGPLAPGVTVAIADPESGAAVGAGLVGEIRIGGPGVSRGYHGHVTVAAAQAAPGPVLPSGDLGFLHEGELFVTGRRKDLIIVNGRNLYAQDIEELVERAAGMAAPNCCAAFGIDDGAGERLAVVVEASRALARSGDVEALGRRIRSAVTAGLGIGPHTLAFVAPGAFPRTTSGKVQRARCKALLAAGALAPVQPRAQAIPQDGDIRETGSAARADTIIAWLRRYAARRINSALDDERRAMAPHLLLDLGNHGLFGLQAPLDAGGQALASVDLVRVMAQLAAIDLTLATVVGVHNGLGLRPLLRSAGAPLRSRWLPALAAGRQLAAFAMSEPQAGSNPRAIGARALRVDGGWRLSGDKHLIGLAAWSGVLSVFARAFDPAGRALGTVALLVPEDAPGLVQGPEALTMGMRAMVQNALRFDDVFVPDEQVLGVPGAGMEVAQDAMAFARLGIGALCVGAMQRCAQLMARYAARRDVVGGRLLDNPVTALRLHELDCAIGAAGALVQALARAMDAADEAGSGGVALQDACSACKCVLSELLWSAADSLMQLLGGRGYLENNIAARLLRDARVLRILEGPSEALYAHLGALVRTPGNPLARIISGQFGAPALADSLARLPAKGQGQWQDWRNGEFAAWTLLAAAARGEAAAWAARRLDALRDAIAAERPAAGACPSATALLARVQAYTLAIGDVEQTLPGAAYALDPLLGREAPEAGRAVTANATATAATATAAAAAAATAAAVDPAAPGAALAPPHASAPVIQHAPASASSVELVRACLLKWLRESAAEPFDGSGVHLSTGTLRRQPHIEVGIDASFGDLGIDSLASVPLALEIEAASGVRVGAELLYDYPTVRALAAYIDEQRDEPREA